MTSPNFVTDVSELLENTLRQFANWAAENYQMEAGEAETLTEPTDSPASYTRGYNDAIRAIPDAVQLWLEEFQ